MSTSGKLILSTSCSQKRKGVIAMTEPKLGAIESKFADLVWENQPISTSALVKLCEKELEWKRTTTYTVLKRLSEKGLFENENGTVKALVSKEEFYSLKTETFVNETFGGSLPAFLAAFASRKGLSGDEIDEIKKLINGYEKEGEQ